MSGRSTRWPPSPLFDDIDERLRQHHTRMRRMQVAFAIVWLLVVIAVVGGVAWGLSNPEAIGSFLGRISAGFNGARS